VLVGNVSFMLLPRTMQLQEDYDNVLVRRKWSDKAFLIVVILVEEGRTLPFLCFVGHYSLYGEISPPSPPLPAFRSMRKRMFGWCR
jgi:hypothetical protein